MVMALVFYFVFFWELLKYDMRVVPFSYISICNSFLISLPRSKTSILYVMYYWRRVQDNEDSHEDLANRSIDCSTVLEQKVFNNTTLSFDDNRVLKMSIGYANICSSVHDHRQKFKCL